MEQNKKGGARKVVVTVDDDHMTSIGEVADRLRAAGVKVDGVMEATGMITGDADEVQAASLKGIKGVASVEEETGFQLPPPDSPIQ